MRRVLSLWPWATLCVAPDPHKRTGIEISEWEGGKKLLVAYRLSQRMEEIPRSLGYAIATLKRETRTIEALVKVIEEATK